MASLTSRLRLSPRQALAPLQVLAAFACALAPGAWAQEPQTPQNAAAAPLQVQAPEATGAAPLFWADGITRADELEAYASSGLNTIVVRLFWQPSPDGSLNPDDLEPQRRFAEAAAARGLKIIYALPPAPATMDSGFRISASSKAYFEVWTTWVGGAMSRLKDTPNLIGWALPDDPRDLPFTDELGWGRWLRASFAAPGFMDAQWKTAFASFDDASLQNVQALIDGYRGAPIPFPDGSNEQLQAMAARANQKLDPSWLFHPASLSLAHYKWDAYRALIAGWAQVIQSNDTRPIFSGRLPDYAQLLSLPPSVAFAVPDLEPGVVEGDAVTHNPQAIAMARRGGRFRAIPTLLTRGSNAVPAELLPALMPRWIQAAQINGASGVSFASWADILDNPALRSSIARLLREPRADDWSRRPIATAAVVLSPLAEGHTLQAGLSLPSRPRGLYGFGEEMVPGEPSNIAYDLRWGTAFGGVDFLSVDDLAPDGSTLALYSTVLLPCALSLSAEQSQGLTNYVRGGGVLVADLGAGSVQAGNNVAGLPPSLANLFGVNAAMQTRHIGFDLKLLSPSPLLPSWSAVGNGREGTQLTRGMGDGGAFSGLAGYPIALGQTQAIAMGDQWFQQLPKNQNGVAPTRIVRSILTANAFGGGAGTAFFAPWLLWSTWRAGTMGFDTFHGDLLARNAAMAASGVPSLVPQPPGSSVPLWAPIVNYADGLSIFNPHPQLSPPAPDEPAVQGRALSIPGIGSPNRGAPNPYGTQPRARPSAPDGTLSEDARLGGAKPGTLAARVQTAGVGDFVWGEALALFDPSAPFSIVGGRPAPIEAPEEDEERAQAVTLQVLVAPGEEKRARLLPVRAQNLSGGTMMAFGARYDEGGIKITAWPNATGAELRQGEFALSLAEAGPARITFYSGRYAIAPRSRHRVTLSISNLPTSGASPPPARRGRGGAPTAPSPLVNGAPRVVTQVLTADERGRLRIEATGSALTVEVGPVDR